MDGFVKILLDTADSYAFLGVESGEGKVHQANLNKRSIIWKRDMWRQGNLSFTQDFCKEALRKLEPQLSQKLNRTLTDQQKADRMEKLSRRLRSQARTVAQAELKSGGRAYWLAQLWRDEGSPAIDDTLIDTDSGSNNDFSEKITCLTRVSARTGRASVSTNNYEAFPDDDDEFPVARFGTGATVEVKDLTVGELKKVLQETPRLKRSKNVIWAGKRDGDDVELKMCVQAKRSTLLIIHKFKDRVPTQKSSSETT